MNKNLVDDTSSKSKELKTFIEHRNDQSMFSLVCKKFSTHLLSATEIEFCYKEGNKTWEHLERFPFIAKRDLKYDFINKSFMLYKKILEKFSIKKKTKKN